MVVRVALMLLGAIMFVPGALQARVWRMSGSEPRFVRAGVGVLAASRLLGGTAFVIGGAVASPALVVVGGACLLLGSAAAAIARRQLKRL